MMYRATLLLLVITLYDGCSQAPPENRPALSSNTLDQNLVRLLNFSVPLIGVEELSDIQSEVFIFDTRTWEEYKVSHLSGAGFLGYSDFDPGQLDGLPKDAKIVLYCSVGYRSEKIGERLLQQGFDNVYNLYGSIFEWVNKDYPIVDLNGESTFKLHTFNENWSHWVENEQIKKTW